MPHLTSNLGKNTANADHSKSLSTATSLTGVQCPMADDNNDNNDNGAGTIHSTDSIINMANGKAAMTAMPTVTQMALRQCGRVVLIANNPSITTATLDELLRPTDLIVLFNHFIHANYFATSPTACALPKLLFFRQIGDSKLHFGMPPRHNNLPAIETMVDNASIGFLFSNTAYQFPDLQDDPSPDDDPIDDSVQLTITAPLKAMLNDSAYSRAIREAHQVVADYPHFEDIHSSAPSSGFFIYRVMMGIRHYLAAHYQHNLEIIMVGFNHDHKTDYFWHGHNWPFEREELARPPNGVTVIRQY